MTTQHTAVVIYNPVSAAYYYLTLKDKQPQCYHNTLDVFSDGFKTPKKAKHKSYHGFYGVSHVRRFNALYYCVCSETT